MSDTHIDILGHLIDKHNYVDIISLLDMYIARLNELNLTNFGIYVNHLNSLRQRYTSLKVKSVAIHGDFIWNMYITFDNKLIVFDWEFLVIHHFPSLIYPIILYPVPNFSIDGMPLFVKIAGLQN